MAFPPFSDYQEIFSSSFSALFLDFRPSGFTVLDNSTTLRNRNRVINKTTLKIHHGDIFDVDNSPIPAGVDAEDAKVSVSFSLLRQCSRRCLSSGYLNAIGLLATQRKGER